MHLWRLVSSSYWSRKILVWYNYRYGTIHSSKIKIANLKSWKVIYVQTAVTIGSVSSLTHWLLFITVCVNHLLVIITVFSSKTTPDSSECSSRHLKPLKYISKLVLNILSQVQSHYFQFFNIFTSFVFANENVFNRLEVNTWRYVVQKESVCRTQLPAFFRISWKLSFQKACKVYAPNISVLRLF